MRNTYRVYFTAALAFAERTSLTGSGVGDEKAQAASCLADGCQNSDVDDDPSLLAMQMKKHPSASIDGNKPLNASGNESQDHFIPSFEHFYELYRRSYPRGNENYNKRRKVYEDRRMHAHNHNQHPNRRWTAGVNDYWDWTDKEIHSLHRSHDAADSFAHILKTDPTIDQTSENEGHAGHDLKHVHVGLPRAVLYDGLAAAKDVKTQGSCGSCWALAATSVLQYYYEMYQGGNRTFSAQELVSCMPNPRECGGGGGCAGATVELAFEWASEKGLPTTEQYPYKGKKGKCLADTSGKSSNGLAFGMTGWQKLRSNDYVHVLRALYENGPIGSSVAAKGWNFYKQGIFDSCEKNAILSHAVLLQGYGIDNSTGDGYWQIQNSWGPSFGENGNIRLLRNNEEEWCGIDDKPQLGSGCKGGPPSVRVCGRCGILFDNAIPLFEGDGNAAREAASENH